MKHREMEEKIRQAYAHGRAGTSWRTSLRTVKNRKER